MKTLKFFNLLCFSMLLFIQCNEKVQNEIYQQINSEIKEFYQVDLSKRKANKLIFINDNGCPNCIVSFSGFVLNNMDKFKDSSLIFINSKGFNVDLDRFIGLNAKNIVISRYIREQSKMLPDLGIIYFKEHTNKVDTIISIDALTITQQLHYIKNKE